jgi:hypothetical protein
MKSAGSFPLLFLAFITALFVCSCTKTNGYSFYDDYEKVEAVYQSERAAAVRTELTGFVGRAEGNAELARKEKRLDYELIIGEAWLRLAVINKALGNAENFTYAIDRAVQHFDRISRFASDKVYQANKGEMLTAYLQKMEETDAPQWRRELGGGKKQ